MSKCVRLTDNASKGFTLFEVLVAIVILSVALLGTASLTGSIIAYNQLADQVTIATTLAQDKIEGFKNANYASITASSETQSIYNITWDVVPDSPATDMKTVTVTVNWNWKSGARDVVLRTIIGQ
jgi:prepilin-type N-terminal cleavage/methylation domain-containing protein